MNDLAEARNRARYALRNAIVGMDRNQRPLTLYTVMNETSGGHGAEICAGIAAQYDCEMLASWEAMYQPTAVRKPRWRRAAIAAWNATKETIIVLGFMTVFLSVVWFFGYVTS